MYSILCSEALLQRCLFFFLQPVAGLTNWVPVRDSRAGAPLSPRGSGSNFGSEPNFSNTMGTTTLTLPDLEHQGLQHTGSQSTHPRFGMSGSATHVDDWAHVCQNLLQLG